MWYDDKQGGGLSGGLNDTAQQIIRILESEFGLNATEISQRMKKGTRTIERYLSALVKQDLVEFRGAKKAGGYFIKGIQSNNE